MTVQTNIQYDKEYIAQISKQKNEPNWMLDIRLNAYERYLGLPLPTLEKTRIDKWNFAEFSLENDEVDLVIAERELKKLSDLGVIYSSLSTALSDHPDLVKKYFMQGLSYENNKLIALHTAFWNKGIFIYVPKDVTIDFPLQYQFKVNDSGAFPHVIVVAETNSNVKIIDYRLASDNIETVHHGAVEVFVNDGAHVEYISINNFSEKIYDYTYRHAEVERNGNMKWIIGEFNAGNTVSSNESLLNGSAAKAEAKSVFVGTGKQRANFVSRIVHYGDHTESTISSRGVLLGESSAVFNGVTEMKKGAVKANADQTEKILMLSSQARGDANPILLIDENDLMASHAASAGPVDQNDIYYLMSRGIPKHEAERLIVHGFLSPVVSKIPLQEVKEHIIKLIERKLS